ncbi:MAG: amylo-alpha-1,6-glucosidase [Eubacteriales bacterium]|nr:amylo-alpha-1,6-glucosidase [Eubacteriales bacterium]
MIYGKGDWCSFDRAIEKEWLITNGIGGFASSTVSGANARRYHGLLIAAIRPPTERHLVLSKLDESFSFCGEWQTSAYCLGSFKCGVYLQEGYNYLESFSIDPLPTYHFRIRDIFIEKKICMVYGENTTVVLYNIKGGKKTAQMRIAPLVNFRDYHSCSKKSSMRFSAESEENRVSIRPFDLDKRITLELIALNEDGIGKKGISAGFRMQRDNWFIDMEYPIEKQRGLDCFEDHYIPGYYEIKIEPETEESFAVVTSIEDGRCSKDVRDIIREEELRLRKLSDDSPIDDEFAKRLFRAADAFIVNRESTGSKTIIAGYPWFTDWGRDTMISLPGLTLATGRHSIAKEILGTFSEYIKDGLIPNLFPDAAKAPAYNSADASLWYFEAVWKYVESSGDYEYVNEKIYPGLKEILKAYIYGTHFGIFMDDDCLIHAGSEKVQITWMDAMAGDKVFTPRNGKAVEINALWYNALKIASSLAAEFGSISDGKVSNGLLNQYLSESKFYNSLAEKVKAAFNKTFWNEELKCLYDVVGESGRDASIRPNQVIALSLTHTMPDRERAGQIIEILWDKLYTTFGLRTLSPDSPDYRGTYSGGPYRRDEAYHQGTVWPWLTGQFIEAYLRFNDYSAASRKAARFLLEPFKAHLDESCIGSISEIFDGNDPMLPKGCFAQAWSVAEILRVYLAAMKEE